MTETNEEKQIIKLEKRDIKYSNTFVIEKSKMYMGLNYDILAKILKEYGLKQSSDPNENHLFGIINYKFYQTNFFLLNGFQFIDIIENKYKLYLNLNMHFPHYYNTHYPKSFLLNATTLWNNIKTQNSVYIARPIGRANMRRSHFPNLKSLISVLLIRVKHAHSV